MQNDILELLPEYIEESKDLLAKGHAAIESVKSGAKIEEVINHLYRIVHTIKGGAAMFELAALTEYAHEVESLLTVFKGDVSKVKNSTLDDILVKLDKISDLLLLPTSEPQPKAEVPSTSTIASAKTAKEEPPVETSKSVRKDQEVIRVPVEKVQRNIDCVSELFLIRNQISYLIAREAERLGGQAKFFSDWESLDNSLRRCIAELEHVSMSMRMMPISNLFTRMEKTIRSYAAETQKKIDVEMRGDQTELDKKILDGLAEPLVHLVRNAMDHGIEPQEHRVAIGKPADGKITLEAKILGNEVLLEVSDDGKGIDPQKLKESAIKKNLDVSQYKSDDELLQIIFLPGFSTSSTVSNVSGRGVGMDAVKTYVEGMGGSLSLRTEINRGTTFTLKLPLGMSVIPALTMRVHGQIYAISTTDVGETLRVPHSRFKVNDGITYLMLRNSFIPCYHLERFFVEEARNDLSLRPKLTPVCITKFEGKEVAVAVSELISNTEIVLKPLPIHAHRVPYATGVTILPTGEPAFVLSLSRLLKTHLADAKTRRVTHASA